MKSAIIILLSASSILPATNRSGSDQNANAAINYPVGYQENTRTMQAGFRDRNEIGKMSAAEFKNQEYCRVELKDFEFDVRFSLVSATVYFSGANFPTLQKAVITSASLKPIKIFMDRCKPGTLVVFDEVKVTGPDKELRTIEGASYLLF